MLRDNLVGLIEPMLSSAGANPLALYAARKKPSDDRPPCLENPRPEGAESTLTENACSPFHAEPRQSGSRDHFEDRRCAVKRNASCAGQIRSLNHDSRSHLAALSG